MGKTFLNPAETSALRNQAGVSQLRRNRKIRAFFAALFAVMAVMMMSVTVFAEYHEGQYIAAYGGDGTEEKPYLVSSFNDLFELIYNNGYGNIVLTNDLEIGEASNKMFQISNNTTIDLNGHWIRRSGISVDDAMFHIRNSVPNYPTLTINDSVGGGGLSMQTYRGTNDFPSVFEYAAADMQSTVIINGGEYNSNGYIFYMNGGNLIVNDGKFTSVRNCIRAWNVFLDIRLNGGEFKTTGTTNPEVLYVQNATSRSERDIVLKNFTAYGKLNCMYGLTPAEGTEVYVDGVKTVPDSPSLGESGSKIEYINSSMPKITKQPTQIVKQYESQVDVEIEASAADSYQWYIIDDAGIPRSFEYAVNQGWCSIVSKSDTTSKLCVKPLSLGLDGKKVLCYVTKDEYTMISDTVEIDLHEPEITTQPTDINITDFGFTYYTSVEGTNIASYQWYLLDKNGSATSFEFIKEKGYGRLINCDGTQKTIYIGDCMPALDGYQLYCDVTSESGITVSSEKATINATGTTIRYIDVEIKDTDKICHGMRVGNFKNVVLRNAAPCTVSDVKIYWMLTDNKGYELGDDEVFEYGNKIKYVISFAPNDGYTISGFSVKINDELVSGISITDGRRYAESSVFSVPAPEGGMHIDATVNRELIAPVLGETPAASLEGGIKTRYEKYTSSVTWSPNDTTFGNKIYTATVKLTPDTDYYFDENSVITINNKILPATIDTDGSATVKLVFPTKTGDIDLDGDVDDTDAALVLKYICGTGTLTPEQLSAAYVNSDNAVDMLDVIAILQNKTV